MFKQTPKMRVLKLLKPLIYCGNSNRYLKTTNCRALDISVMIHDDIVKALSLKVRPASICVLYDILISYSHSCGNAHLPRPPQIIIFRKQTEIFSTVKRHLWLQTLTTLFLPTHLRLYWMIDGKPISYFATKITKVKPTLTFVWLRALRRVDV